ncbi:MAG: PEP-utilizing enzyme [Verrucomicrobiota bacterium]
MLSRWKAPIVNDFLTMVHFGMLKKLTNQWLADLDTNIQNDLLAGECNLESAEPTKVLIRLAGEVAAEPELKRLVEETPVEDLFEALNQSRFAAFFRKVSDYIDRFGFRCMSEMKLEETDLFTDPKFLFVCLKNYLRAGTTDLAAYEQREKTLRGEAERMVAARLTGLRRAVYFWSLRHARKAIRNRENTRFARTRIYGVARSMFQAMGADLCGRGVLARPDDIFFLTLDEIYGIHQGTLTAYNLRDLVELRRREYARFNDLEPKPRFLTRGPVYWQNKFLAEPEAPDVPADAGYDLRGLPCCPGVVEGVVKLVQSPKDDLTLNGEILVAARTDPGWVPLYPSVSGLLVERGSLLSHSAIVAREMGLPAIVGIKGLVKTLKSGMRIRMDGQQGTVKILDGL